MTHEPRPAHHTWPLTCNKATNVSTVSKSQRQCPFLQFLVWVYGSVKLSNQRFMTLFHVPNATHNTEAWLTQLYLNVYQIRALLFLILNLSLSYPLLECASIPGRACVPIIQLVCMSVHVSLTWRGRSPGACHVLWRRKREGRKKRRRGEEALCGGCLGQSSSVLLDPLTSLPLAFLWHARGSLCPLFHCSAGRHYIQPCFPIILFPCFLFLLLFLLAGLTHTLEICLSVFSFFPHIFTLTIKSVSSLFHLFQFSMLLFCFQVGRCYLMLSPQVFLFTFQNVEGTAADVIDYL